LPRDLNSLLLTALTVEKSTDSRAFALKVDASALAHPIRAERAWRRQPLQPVFLKLCFEAPHRNSIQSRISARCPIDTNAIYPKFVA
jgi:hypothetical protein